MLDFTAPLAPLGFFFGRIGNFINAELIGRVTNMRFGMIFPYTDGLPRHPSQLYEAISYFIILATMLILYKKSRNRFRNGFFFGLGSVLFFTARFVIEFVKEDQVGFEEGMTFNMGQLLSIPFIMIGIGFMIYGLWKTKKLSTQHHV